MRSPSRVALAAAAACMAVAAPGAQAQGVAPACDPFTTPAERSGNVPDAREVIGIDLGERDVTTAESDAFVEAVDRASDRVVSGTLGTFVQGRPLRYAIGGPSGQRDRPRARAHPRGRQPAVLGYRPPRGAARSSRVRG